MTAGYVLFALGCLVLMLASAGLKLRYASASVRVARLRALLGGLCRGYRRYAHALRLAQVEYQHVRPVSSGLVVANHPSLIDVLWIVAAMPQVCCVLKSDVERNWLMRPLARDLGYLSNRDPEHLLAEGALRLAAGEVLLIFPEATRTLPGKLPDFRLGAAELLLRSGAPVHPLVIHTSQRYLSKAEPWYRFPDAPLAYRLCLHPAQGPFADKPETGQVKHTGQALRQRRRQINAELEALFHRELQ